MEKIFTATMPGIALSRSELAQSPFMMFDRADADHDGRVTKPEYDDIWSPLDERRRSRRTVSAYDA